MVLVETLPFDELIDLTTANPQAQGQPPLTFYRQVIDLTRKNKRRTV